MVDDRRCGSLNQILFKAFCQLQCFPSTKQADVSVARPLQTPFPETRGNSQYSQKKIMILEA